MILIRRRRRVNWNAEKNIIVVVFGCFAVSFTNSMVHAKENTTYTNF